MANIRLMYSNLFDSVGSDPTASSEATGFPVENLNDILHLKHWRATGDSSEWVKKDLGTAYNIWCVIIRYHNLTVGATLKFQANATDSWGTPSVDETITVTSDVIVKFFSSAQSYRWWRISIVDASNPYGYVRLGRVYIGSYFEPSRNHEQPVRKLRVDPSVKRYSTGGQVFVNQKEAYIKAVYNFPSILSAEVADYVTMWGVVKQSIPYFVCEVPDSDPYLTTYYVINARPWETEEMYHKGALEIEADEMR